MGLLGVLVLSTLAATVLCQASSLTFYCIDEAASLGQWRMEMDLRTSTPLAIGDVHGINIDTNTSSSYVCSNDPNINFVNTDLEIHGDGSAATPYSLEVAINSNTGSLKPGFQACGYSHPFGTTIYEWGIQIHTVPEFQIQNRVRCDFSDPTKTETRSVQSSVNITQAQATIVELMPAVRLSVVDGSTNQPLTEINTIDPKLKVELRMGPEYFMEVPDAIGVYPHDCYLCDTEDCTGTLQIQLTDEKGCAMGSVLSSGFSGDGLTLFSSPLNLLFLANSDIQFIYIRCLYSYCTPASLPSTLCMDSCQSLSRKKRKRREVEHVLSIKHSLQSEDMDALSESRRQKRSPDSQPRAQVDTKCKPSKGFVITMVALASILVVAVLISMVQCARLFLLSKE